MIGVAAGDRVVLELAEAAGKPDVLGAGNVLVAEEQHLVLQQKRPDFVKEVVVGDGSAEIDVAELGADAAGQLLDLQRSKRRRTHDCYAGLGSHPPAPLILLAFSGAWRRERPTLSRTNLNARYGSRIRTDRAGPLFN